MNDVEDANAKREEWTRENLNELRRGFAEEYWAMFADYAQKEYARIESEQKTRWDVYDEDQERKRSVNEDDPRQDR